MAEPIAVVSIAVILFLGATGINLAIEDWRDRNASKPKNRIVAALRLIFEGVENAVKFIGIAWGLLCFAVFVVLPVTPMKSYEEVPDVEPSLRGFCPE